MNYIRKEAPEVYQSLADTHLAQMLVNNRKASTELFGKVLDGRALLENLTQNKNTLLKIYGAEKYKVLKNFAEYVEQVGPAMKTKPIGGLEGALRTGFLFGGSQFAPAIYLSGEGSAYVLAKGLSNPKSILYKAFLKKANFGKGGATMGPLAASIAGDKTKQKIKNKLQAEENGMNVGQLKLFGNF